MFAPAYQRGLMAALSLGHPRPVFAPQNIIHAPIFNPAAHPLFTPTYGINMHPALNTPVNAAVGTPGQGIPGGMPAPTGLFGVGNGRPPKKFMPPPFRL